MNSENFSVIAKRYKETSIVQNSAADILLSLLDIKENESVLDVGCGTGNLTKKIFDVSKRIVVGIDPSEGMVFESKKSFGNEIEFQTMQAEDIPFNNEFDVVFCNSTFQWIHNIDKAVANFYRSLKKGGRIGIQAPAKKRYCPNFIEAIDRVTHNTNTNSIFRDFNNPWVFLDTANEYSQCFIKQGFHVAFSEIQTLETFHSSEETYKIFASGAIAGYLNREYYKNGFDEKYSNEFQNIVREAFCKQAIYDGKIKLIFNRIYLIAVKM